MHKTLLGQELDLPQPWAQQGFTFRSAGLLCGLTQHEGGACGVLAAVQGSSRASCCSRRRAAAARVRAPPTARRRAPRSSARRAHHLGGARGPPRERRRVQAADAARARDLAGELLVRVHLARRGARGRAGGRRRVVRERGPAWRCCSTLYGHARHRDGAARRRRPRLAHRAERLLRAGARQRLLVGRAHSNVVDGEKASVRWTARRARARGCAASTKPSCVGFLTLFERAVATARCWWSAIAARSGRSTRSSSSCSPRAATRRCWLDGGGACPDVDPPKAEGEEEEEEEEEATPGGRARPRRFAVRRARRRAGRRRRSWAAARRRQDIAAGCRSRVRRRSRRRRRPTRATGRSTSISSTRWCWSATRRTRSHCGAGRVRLLQGRRRLRAARERADCGGPTPWWIGMGRSRFSSGKSCRSLLRWLRGCAHLVVVLDDQAGRPLEAHVLEDFCGRRHVAVRARRSLIGSSAAISGECRSRWEST